MPGRRRRAKMARRLVRWLQSPSVPSASLVNAVQTYCQKSAFVDLARLVLLGGEQPALERHVALEERDRAHHRALRQREDVLGLERGRSVVDELLVHRHARVRPFLFAGLGTTFFSARDLQSETKLSSGFGGGVKYFPRSNVGLRLHLRSTPTWLDDESSADFCDPFGFCQGALQQVEVMVGLVLRY